LDCGPLPPLLFWRFGFLEDALPLFVWRFFNLFTKEKTKAAEERRSPKGD
jgi:hypothetical protein